MIRLLPGGELTCVRLENKALAVSSVHRGKKKGCGEGYHHYPTIILLWWMITVEYL